MHLENLIYLGIGISLGITFSFLYHVRKTLIALLRGTHKVSRVLIVNEKIIRVDFQRKERLSGGQWKPPVMAGKEIVVRIQPSKTLARRLNRICRLSGSRDFTTLVPRALGCYEFYLENELDDDLDAG